MTSPRYGFSGYSPTSLWQTTPGLAETTGADWRLGWFNQAIQAAMGEVEPETPLAAVQSAWADAVGEAIAAEASPVAERDGVVTIACSSATWAQELDLLGERILTQLTAELPPESGLRALRFTATGNPD